MVKVGGEIKVVGVIREDGEMMDLEEVINRDMVEAQ